MKGSPMTGETGERQFVVESQHAIDFADARLRLPGGAGHRPRYTDRQTAPRGLADALKSGSEGGGWKRNATGCSSLPMHTDLRTPA